jgi:hypothetical protein
MKNPWKPHFQVFDDSKLRSARAIMKLSLAEFHYLFGDRQALPKTPEKTEMVLRFPLGFA